MQRSHLCLLKILRKRFSHAPLICGNNIKNHQTLNVILAAKNGYGTFYSATIPHFLNHIMFFIKYLPPTPF